MMKSLFLITALLFSAALFANEQWQTIHTEHFNVHYTPSNQAWANSAAQELEVVRDKVLAQQNRALDETVDVIVFDPLNAANGFALPTTNKPLMALFTTPPHSDHVVSNSSGWQQLLILHEYIHLVHLAQPTRSHWRQLLRNSWDLYDLAEASMPRWVAEGYATLMESKMTGRGRLYDNYTEALLIEFAQQGMLPSYGQLSHFDGDFMAGSMAYLIGARFLAWLELNYSEQTLDAVWTRMQAVKSRDFDEAFTGVFNDSPSKLYRRFIAEYTYQAMAKEVSEQPLTSKLWLELDLYAHNLTLSPSGEQLAIVERDNDDNTRLIVYSTSDNTEAQQSFNEQQQALLADDPADIADTPPKVFSRKQRQVLNQINRQGINNPQWLNESTIYFTAYSTVAKGAIIQISDLYRWHIDTGEIERLTENAGIRRFSIDPSTNLVYAEQAKNGFSELVRLDLSTGQLMPLYEKSLATVYDYPVISPNKQQLAYLKTSLNENWQLYIQDLNSQKQYLVPAPAGYQYLSQPSWQGDGKAIFFTAGKDKAIDIYRYDLENQQLKKLSQGQEAVAYPMEMKAGGLLYFSITPQGPNVKYFDSLPEGNLVTDIASTHLAPLLFINEFTLPEAKIYSQSSSNVKDYNPLNQKPSLFLSEQYHSASAALLTVGVKSNDLLKQLDLQAGYSIDLHDSALKGAFAAAKYRSNELEFKAKLFDYSLLSQRQYRATNANDIDAAGAVVSASYPMQFEQLQIKPEISYNYTDLTQDSEQWLRAKISQSWQYDRQAYALGQSINVAWLDGESMQQDWQGYDLDANLRGKAFDIPIYINFTQQYRDNYHLALGGFRSNLVDQDTQANIVFAPELPFMSMLGKRYQGYGGGISYKGDLPWLYYQQHQLDDQVYGQSYGLKWQGDLNFGIGPAGLNDLNISIGAVKVEGDSFDDELRAWLSFYYSL